MIKICNGHLPTYHFELLSGFPEVKHAVFTRRGGVSPPPFHSLNVSYHTGDLGFHVVQNRERIRISIGAGQLISADQTHGTGIKIVGHPIEAEEIPGVDALLTDLPGVALLIKQADCQSILLYDPKRKVIGNVHCGWRGNVLNIIGCTIHTMADHFGCRPQDILAGIGPSLGPCCAEFKNYRQELPPSFWPYEVAPRYFDLWAISKSQLCAAGVANEHIETAGICTKCRAEDFFSYRNEHVTGRFGTAISLMREC